MTTLIDAERLVIKSQIVSCFKKMHPTGKRRKFCSYQKVHLCHLGMVGTDSPATQTGETEP